MKSHAPFPSRRPREGFTLIELLVVISIIAILASLAFPALQGALEQGKKAQARNDVQQIATAIKAYNLEYGKLPGTATADGAAPANLISILTSSNTNNPRGIVFLEPKTTTGKKGGYNLSDGKYYDPWGTAYTVTLDYDYNNRMTSNVTGSNAGYFTIAIVSSAGPDTNLTTGTDNIANVK